MKTKEEVQQLAFILHSIYYILNLRQLNKL